MNYSELTAAIQDYCENTFTSTQLATFVQNAEQRIYNSVQLPALRKNVTGSTTDGNKYVAAPSDFLSVFSFAVVDGDGNYEYLLNKDVNFIRQAYPNPSDTGLPRYYAIFGPQSNDFDELTFILGPTPDDDYVVWPESRTGRHVFCYTKPRGYLHREFQGRNRPCNGKDGGCTGHVVFHSNHRSRRLN